MGRVELLETAITDALEGRLDPDRQAAAARAAHAVSGTAGTFGYLGASAHARDLERALKAEPLPLRELPRLAGLVVGLREELDRGPVGGAPAPAPPPVAPPEDVALLVVGGGPGRAARLADEATTRGLPAQAAEGVDDARPLLGALAPELVLLDLGVPEGLDAALAFLAEAASGATVLAVLDPADEVDRLELAQAGVHAILPLALEIAPTIDEVLAVRERVRAAGTRVLAVDDDAALRDAVRVVLEDADLDVVTSDGSEDLFALLDQHEPDLLLLDVDLPWGHSGIDLCRAVRADGARGTLPIVVLSARTDPETVLEVFRAGADDYVAKPFVGPELLVRIANRLERARLLRELTERDALTGLPGPESGRELLRTLWDRTAAAGEPFCVAYLDSDDVEELNHRHGVAAGDAALRATADVLRRAFRGEAVVARWRGDEFVVAFGGLAPQDARERLGRVLDAVREGGPVVPDEPLPRTMSAGLAFRTAETDDADALLRTAERAAREAAQAGGGRIVVVGADATAVAVADVVLLEDDLTLVALLRHALEGRGYTVRHLADGAEAADLVASEERRVAGRVVLLDWDLPGIDGMRILREMRRHGVLEHTRVIMLTARASEPEILQALDAGAVDHVAKPFSVPVLLQRVRRAMGA
nr:response regulator [Patulibacter sp. SYSU D01012]